MAEPTSTAKSRKKTPETQVIIEPSRLEAGAQSGGGGDATPRSGTSQTEFYDISDDHDSSGRASERRNVDRLRREFERTSSRGSSPRDRHGTEDRERSQMYAPVHRRRKEPRPRERLPPPLPIFEHSAADSKSSGPD